MSVQALIFAWSLCLVAERARRIDPKQAILSVCRFSQHGFGVFLGIVLLLHRLCDRRQRCKPCSRRLRPWNDLVSRECFNSRVYATDTVRSSIALIYTTVKKPVRGSCVRVAKSKQELFGTQVKVYGHRPGCSGDMRARACHRLCIHVTIVVWKNMTIL